MYPLLTREGLSIPTWAATGLFGVVTLLCTSKRWQCYKSLLVSQQVVLQLVYTCQVSALLSPFQLVLSLSLLLGLCILSHIVSPPKFLPDFFPVLTSCYCCLLFMATLVYFIFVQVSLQSSPYQQQNLIWDYEVSQCMYQRVKRSNINLAVCKKEHSD